MKVLGPAFLLLALAQATVPADRRVTIPSDKWVLVGNFQAPAEAEPRRPSGRVPAVLLLHGAARDRRAYIPLSAELAQRGVASLRIDLRGEGESTNLGRFEPGVHNQLLAGSERDIAAALAWLRTRPGVDPDRIGVLGASFSGESMAIAARAGAVGAAYVALSPGNFSDESAHGIDPSGLPWWFIASKDERFAHRVVGAIPTRSKTARITLVEGNSHASDILSPHYTLNAEIADWFVARLAGTRAPELWGGLLPGPYAVGFSTESVAGEGGTVRVDVWYPGQRGAAPGLTFGDYLTMSDDIRGVAAGFPSSPDAVRTTLATAMSGDPAGVPAAALDRILASRLAAVRNAAAAGGRFPLVLWTPRYATTTAQSVLSECLASRGFVVAYARPVGIVVKLPFEVKTPDEKRAELEARVSDLKTALAALEKKSYVNASAIGVVAWSYTGEMATAFQQIEPRVTLVAGLSTTVLNNWVYRDDAALAALDPAKLTAAYAVLHERGDQPLPRPAIMDRLAASYLIDFPGVAHGSFNALEGYIPSLLGIQAVQRWSLSAPEGVRSYEAMAVILTRLLRHHVGGKPPQPLAAHPLLSGIPENTAGLR